MPSPLRRPAHLSAVGLSLLVGLSVAPAALAAEPGDGPAVPSAVRQPAAMPSVMPDPVAPRPVAEGAEEEAQPGLDPSVIKDVVRSRMPAIKHCYEKELRKEPTLTGVVTVSFTVGPKGTVTSAAVKESTLKNKDVEGCMVDDIKGWVFPEPRGGESVPITYPFKFKPPTL